MKRIEYDKEFKEIGKYLMTSWKEGSWRQKNFYNFRKKAHKFFLHQGYLWKHPKFTSRNSRRLICNQDQWDKIIKELHDQEWVGHWEIWATFTKVKERYWWLKLCNNVKRCVVTYTTYQLYSNIKHRDKLHSTYLPGVHYKWMVDLVAM